MTRDTREELEKAIADLDHKIFLVEVADHLSPADYDWLAEKKAALRELQRQLKELDA